MIKEQLKALGHATSRLIEHNINIDNLRNVIYFICIIL